MEVHENSEKSEIEEDRHIKDEELQPKKERFQTEKDKVQGIYLIKLWNITKFSSKYSKLQKESQEQKALLPMFYADTACAIKNPRVH